MYDGQLNRRPLSSSELDQEQFAMVPEVGALRNAEQFQFNIYIGGETGSGKTTLLRHMEYFRRGSTVFVRAEETETPAQLVAAIASAINPADSSQVNIGETELDVATIHEALQKRRELPGYPRLVLVDGANPEQVQTLFGRFRDSLWDLPLTWIVACNRGAPLPPADAFFDQVIRLSPWPKEQIRDLIDKRIEQWVPTWRWREDWRELVASVLAPASPLRTILTLQAMVQSRDPVKLLDSLKTERRQTEALPERLRSIYEALNGIGPVHAGDEQLMDAVGVTRSRIVHSLKELEEMGMVEAKRDGRRVYYTSLLNSLLSGTATLDAACP